MKLRPIAIAFGAIVSSAALAHGTGNQQHSQAWPGTQSSQVSEQSSSMGASAQSAQSSDTIKQVQEKLSQHGQDPGPADGKLGPKTMAALKDFQKQNNLQPSGKLDQQTLAALQLDESSGSASTGSSAPSQDSSSQDSSSNSASGSSMDSTPSSSAPSSSSEQAPAGSTGSTGATSSQ
jgi:peptidoglycan hydrolase-like protein with peptidoglycan-binding domain